MQAVALPARMAHALQIVRTADALARAGHRAVLYVRADRPGGEREALAEILGREPSAGVEIAALSFDHKGLAGAELRARLLAGAVRGDTAFYARHRRSALWLLRARAWLGRRARIAYEFHNLEHVLAAATAAAATAAPEARRIQREERQIADSADALAAISDPLADDLVAAFGLARRPEVIPDGVDLAQFRGRGRPFASAASAAGRARLLYAGSLYRHKGVDSLLGALALLPDGVELLVAGGQPPSELERLRAAAAELGVGARTSFLGQLAPRDVPALYERADVVVLPAGDEARSQRYTSPLKLFEAMASGVPIAAAGAPSLASVLRDGRTAFLASSHEPAALAEAVRRALGDPPRARAIGAAAARAAEDYTWERRADRIAALVGAPGP